MKWKFPVVLAGLVAAVLLVPAADPVWAQADPTQTPPELVAAYDSLSQVLIGAQKTEWNLVHSILASTYSHAQVTAAKATALLRDGKGAGDEIEALASLVSQLANEGDAAVAAVRKRLIDAGHHHHHHHADDDKGEFDEGYVIVTRAAKKKLLDAANRIARLGDKPSVDALEREWSGVKKEFKALHKNVKGM